MSEPITVTPKRIKAPDFYRNKLVGNITAVGESNYRKGVAEPKKNPITAGIEAEARFKDEMQKVISEKRRKRMLEKKSTMAEWGKYTGTYSDRLVPGVTGRVGEVDKFWKGWQPVLTKHAGEIDPLPTATFSERKSKMLANVDKLKGRKGTWLSAAAS